MNSRVVLKQSLWVVWILFVASLFFGPPVQAQVTGKILASEELSSGVRVDILELKRTSGGSVTLRFAVVNDTKEGLSIKSIFSNLGIGYNWDVSKVSLLDTPNKKKYLVMTDSENTCVCSRGGRDTLNVRGGTRGTFWAKFQAPPENVTKLTVEMPGTPPFEDLPLGQ